MRQRLSALIPVLLTAAPCAACLWDYDTLRDERRGLPGIAEVLSGRFERHSPFFYEQRVAQMTALLARDPKNGDALNNLAVAYQKLGKDDQAIEVMLSKARAAPDQYTTEANLGTFYFLKGDLVAGVLHIENALRINPNAHFGREEYQLRLAKYLIATQDKPVGRLADFLGINLFVDPDGEPSPNIGLLYRGSPDVLKTHDPKGKAVEGIVGMLRFGPGTSPDLYYALGNILALRGDKHLACRAYKRAIEFGHPRSQHIQDLLTALRNTIPEGDHDASDKVVDAERAEAAEWLRAYQEFEDNLVRAGKDTQDESNYASFYATRGRSPAPLGFAVSDYLPKDRHSWPAFAAVGALSVFLLIYIARRARTSRRHLTAEQRVGPETNAADH